MAEDFNGVSADIDQEKKAFQEAPAPALSFDEEVAGADASAAPDMASMNQASGLNPLAEMGVVTPEKKEDPVERLENSLSQEERDQVDAFVEQLRIAHARKLPVELHLRDEEDGVHTTGHDLALDVLRSVGVPEAGCDLHCYTSGPDVMEPFVELGCHVAFGGAATFARSEDIRAAAAACPEHLLLSETDSPYMAPVPLRGMECEPAMVAFSAACVAQVREEVGVAMRAQTYRVLWDNANQLLCRR